MHSHNPDPYVEGNRFQLAFFDATALAAGIACPKRYFFLMSEGWQAGQPDPEGQPWTGSVHLDFGTFVHAGAQTYNMARLHGADPEKATELAVERVMQMTWPDREREVWGGRWAWVEQCTDRTRSTVKVKRCPNSKKETPIRQPCLGPQARECSCGKPLDVRLAYLPNDKTKNRNTVIRAVIALCDQFTLSGLKPAMMDDGRAGTEFRWFRELSIDRPDGHGKYQMTGSIDLRVTDDRGNPGGAEIKTTQKEPNASFYDSFMPGAQVYSYAWGMAGPDGTGLPLYLVVVHCGVGYCEVYLKPLHIPHGVLNEWQREAETFILELQGYSEVALALEANGQDPEAAYPRRVVSCNSMPGAPNVPCPFRKICQLAPADRTMFLNHNFHRDRWNPLEAK